MVVSERGTSGFEYVRPLRPLHFPVEAKVPESQRHLELRTALYLLLSFHLRGRAAVGSDQFVYFDASDPHAYLAPDLLVKLDDQGAEIVSWKVWERGTPDLAVEIASRSDAPDEPWRHKLARYHRLGVRELVLFDPRARQPIRVWDYVDGDLAERKVEPNAPVPSPVLGLWWVSVPHERWGPMLRVARDALGTELVPTELEFEAEQRKREAEARKREALRVRELEQELARLKSSGR